LNLAPSNLKVSIRQKSHPVGHLKNPVKSMVSEDQKFAKKNKNRTSMDGVGISVWGNEKGEVTHLQEKPRGKIFCQHSGRMFIHRGRKREKL